MLISAALLKRTGAALLLAAALGQAQGINYKVTYKNSPVEANGRLKVVGTHLVNQKNVPVQLRGLATHGIQWFAKLYRNGEALKAAAVDWKADILRLTVYVTEGGYTTHAEMTPADFDREIDSYIATCLETGIYCILDWHVHHPGFPSYYLKDAKVFFERYSKKYGDIPNLMYEICNEPSSAGGPAPGHDVKWPEIVSYANEIIPIIRKNAPNAIILVGTPDWSSLGLSGGKDWRVIADNRLAFDNILYVVHFYAAGHHWLPKLTEAAKVLPLFATEWAASSFTNSSKIDLVKAAPWVKMMADHKIGWAYWNYSDDSSGFAMFKPRQDTAGPFLPTGANVTETGRAVYDLLRTPADAWGERVVVRTPVALADGAVPLRQAPRGMGLWIRTAGIPDGGGARYRDLKGRLLVRAAPAAPAEAALPIREGSRQ